MLMWIVSEGPESRLGLTLEPGESIIRSGVLTPEGIRNLVSGLFQQTSLGANGG